MTRQERRAIELLADCGRDGVTEDVMQAHGFAIPLMVKLATAGLVRVSTERVLTPFAITKRR